MGYIIGLFMICLALFAIHYWYNLFKFFRYCKKYYPEPYRYLTQIGFFATDKAIYKNYNIDDPLFITILTIQRRVRIAQTIANIILICGVTLVVCLLIYIRYYRN
jgi:hypothetical protein